MKLKLIRIDERSTDNERLLIKALEDCNTEHYLVFDTTFDGQGISNLDRHMFLLPSLDVKKGDYIRLYTKSGDYSSFLNKSNTTTHNIYWNLENHVWNNEGDRAFLVHYDDWSSLDG